MNKVILFFKENLTQIVLVVIAVLLMILAMQSTGTVSLESTEEAEIYTEVVDNIFGWVLLASLVGVVSFIAVTGKGAGLDHSLSVELKELQDSKRFDQMEVDFQNAPEHIKAMVEVGNTILKMANTLLQSESIETSTDVVDDLLDGPE